MFGCKNVDSPGCSHLNNLRGISGFAQGSVHGLGDYNGLTTRASHATFAGLILIEPLRLLPRDFSNAGSCDEVLAGEVAGDSDDAALLSSYCAADNGLVPGPLSLEDANGIVAADCSDLECLSPCCAAETDGAAE